MIKDKFKSKQGSVLIYAVIITLSMLLIVSAVAEYLRLKTITSHIEDTLQSSVISTSVENYENIFSSNREGYVSGNLYNDHRGIWEEIVSKGDIYELMSEVLGLERDAGYYVKFSGGDGDNLGNIEYKLSNLKVEIKSPPLRADVENKFIAESTIDFEMPYSFAWKKLPPLKLKLKVNSEHMVMF